MMAGVAISLAYPLKTYMTQCHFRSVEVEEIHQLDGLALPECPVVDTPRFVVQFDVNGEYFSVLCISLVNSQVFIGQKLYD
jgi:hypothetical protein